ncbi:MAG: HD-GYP domain-containing protein [Nitrospinae bacterium]|nr:HD-GYP domain-containing protein [Nitrospinota bacterium]
MIKKVSVRDLKEGMYVCEFDRPWLETGFLFHKFPIKTDKQIEKIRKYCNHVYIDTDKGEDVKTSVPAAEADKKTEQEMKETIQEALKRESPPEDRVKFQEEIKQAAKAHNEANYVIRNAMQDVRMGKSISSGDAKKAVNNMADSIMRNRDALLCLSQIKSKDEYTSFHSINVCILCLAFGRHMGYSEIELKTLGIGALLHDIGKTKVPDEILNKAGKLTPEEFEIMKKHTIYSAEILSKTHGIPQKALEIPLQHHERYNGTGYPRGLKGDEIGVSGMLSSIADVYDAITSTRVYHTGVLPHEALKRMYEWKGKDFHNGLLEQFIKCVGIYPPGTIIKLQTGEVGVVVSVNRANVLKPRIAVVIDSQNKRYTPPKTLDMSNGGGKWNIKEILEPASCGINPQEIMKGLLFDQLAGV